MNIDDLKKVTKSNIHPEFSPEEMIRLKLDKNIFLFLSHYRKPLILYISGLFYIGS